LADWVFGWTFLFLILTKVKQNQIFILILRFICVHIKNKTMGVTALKRKLRRKRLKQNTRVIKIKQLSAKPVIKNVDIEELKKNFA